MTNQAEKPAARQRTRTRHTVVASTKTVEAAYPVLKAQASRQTLDEFSQMYTANALQGNRSIIEPMYAPQILNRYAMASGVLRTCLEAMATNIDGFGYNLEYIGPEEMRDNAEVQAEHDRVMGLLDHPNGEYSLIDLRKRFRVDKEAAGYGAIEIVRNEDDGFPDLLFHVPGFTVRMTSQDNEAVEALRYLPRPGAQANNMLKTRKRFRRIVQQVGGHLTYFRENGDPRRINADTGEAIGDQSDAPDATDMVLDYIYAPGSRYGAPRWVGNLRSVLGIQESENVNLGYFKDNGIPAMMVFVLGGGLSETGMNDFQSGLQNNRGAGMQQKVALIEVQGDANAASEEGAITRPDVKVQSLTRERQTDAFFQDFETNAAKKIRSSFRLPAMFAGLTEEVRYAVAEASLTIAENQVFGPERTQTDDLFNYQILTYGGEPMRYWRYRSNPPRISSEDAVMKAIKTFDSVGAMTPNIAIQFANEMFDMQLPPVEDDWGDQPFSLTVADSTREARNNKGAEGAVAPAAKSTVPKARVRHRRRVPTHKDATRVPGDMLVGKGQTTPEGEVRQRRKGRVNVPGSGAMYGAETKLETLEDEAANDTASN